MNFLRNKNIIFQNHWNERNKNDKRNENNEWNENDAKRRILKKLQIDKNLNFENSRIARKKQTRKKFQNIFISNLKNLKKNQFKNFCAIVYRRKRNDHLFFICETIFEKKLFFKNKTNKNFNVKKISTKKKMTFSFNFRLWSIHDLISFLIFVKNCFYRVFARIWISFLIEIENCSRFVMILKQLSFSIEIKNYFNSTFVLKNSSNSKIVLFKKTFCCF